MAATQIRSCLQQLCKTHSGPWASRVVVTGRASTDVPGSHGCLASVFWRYGGDGHEALVDEARRKLLCLKGP